MNFQTLFESLPRPCIVLLPDSPRFTIVAASDAYLRATSKSRDSLLGQSVFDVFPDTADGPQAHAARPSRAALEHARLGREAGGVNKPWWNLANLPVVSADGQVAYIIHHLDEVNTDEPPLAAEDRLQQLYAQASQLHGKAQALFKAASGGIFVSDRETRHLDVNSAGCALLGYTRDELLAMRTSDLIAPEDVDRWRHALAHIGGGDTHLGEWMLRRKDGSVACIEIRTQRLHDGSHVSLMRNISEQRRRLESKRAADRELSAQVALRTQELHKLGAALEMAEDRERRKIARDLHDDIGQTLAAARIWLASLCRSEQEDVRNAANKVDALVDHANQATRSLAAQIAPAMLYELGLPPALEWLGQDVYQTFGLHVSVVDDGHPKPLAHDARSILYRATRELLINAAKHAHVESALVDIKRQGDRIVVCVSDAGVGFDSTNAPTLPQTGSGLGLTSVRERLTFIGGTAEIRSVPGLGTVAELSAPLDADALKTECDLEDDDSSLSEHAAHATHSELQSIIDAIHGHVAVLDERGTIEAVNRAWKAFAHRHGDPGMPSCGPGVNYLEVCRRSDSSDPLIRHVTQGLEAVLEGRQSEFVSFYPCEFDGVVHLFMMHAAPMVDKRHLIIHIDVTDWADPSQLPNSFEDQSTSQGSACPPSTPIES